MTTVVGSNLLLSQLQCPVCYETLSAPIHMCLVGHNICHHCKDRVGNQCPMCRQPIGRTRNYALEQLVEGMFAACRYRENGCFYKGVGKSLTDHETTCMFTDHRCPLSAELGCRFHGIWEQILSHVHAEHRELVFTGGAGQHQVTNFDAFFGTNTYLMVKFEGIFKITERVSLDENILEMQAVHVGPITNSSKFLFEVSITDRNGTGNSMNARSNVKPWSRSNDIYNTNNSSDNRAKKNLNTVPSATSYFDVIETEEQARSNGNEHDIKFQYCAFFSYNHLRRFCRNNVLTYDLKIELK